MTTKFDIKMYDIGGNGAIANDGKLTGSEVKKAQKDGWTVWDGYSVNDSTPKNTKGKKKEIEKKYINFNEFDKGGRNAIAGDGKLTGDEVARANAAGYTHIYDGITKDNISKSTTKREQGYAFGGISRSVANKTNNKLAIGAAQILDLLVLPFEMAASMTQASSRD